MEVSELQASLDAFARGQLTFEAFCDALRRRLAASPEESAEVMGLIEQARAQQHIDVAQYRVLCGLASAGTQPAEPGEDATVILPGGTAGRAAEHPPPAAPPDADKTVVLPGGSRARAAPAPVQASGESPSEAGIDQDGATVVRHAETAPPAEDADGATVINPAATHAAGVPGRDKTVALGDATEGSGAPRTQPTRTQTAVTGSRPGAAPGGEVGEGYELKGRFQLLSPLGKGGMGMVWKAVDKLKAEARDKDPYVAIKLLSGDFKDHPESFIALQRETAKQQKLAHPNIATVYDFDRDGETVYMTMQVLEGQPLDEYIKSLPEGGLPVEEALPIIEQLASGLAYAHSNNLVHSDLKPGNAYYTKGGAVKLLDFGIARASATKADAGGETTVFDPGELGALTPTYATVEMFAGEEPDPRDDIYALAIITYQLLTGRHPFDKKSAPKAMEAKLSAAPIAKLNKRQNRALQRGLAFLRAERTPSVEEFMEGVLPKKSYVAHFVIGSVLLLALVGGISYKPVLQWRAEQEREKIIALMQPGDFQSIQHALEQARQLEDPEQTQAVFADSRVVEHLVAWIAGGDEDSIRHSVDMLSAFPRLKRTVMARSVVKKAIRDLYDERINTRHWNPLQGLYDYEGARAVLQELDKLYPDSLAVNRARQKLDKRRADELARLEKRFAELLSAGAVMPGAGEDIDDVLATIRRIEPDTDLGRRPEVAERFAALAREAAAAHDYTGARELVDAGLVHVPDDAVLGALGAEIDAEVERLANERRVAQIERDLATRWRAFESMVDFQTHYDDIATLARLRPHHRLLADMREALGTRLASELAARGAAGEFDEAEQLLLRFGPFVDIPVLDAVRWKLSKAERAAGFVPARDSARIDEQLGALHALLGAPRDDTQWTWALDNAFRALLVALPGGDALMRKARESVAGVFLEQSKRARDALHFDAARAAVARAQPYYPGYAALALEQAAIAEDELLEQERIAAERRLARINTLKDDVLALAARDKPIEARRVLDTLAGELGPDDAFLTREGPGSIAESYLRLAAAAAPVEVEAAIRHIEAGLAIAPGLPALEQALQGYQQRLVQRALALQVQNSLGATARAPPTPAPRFAGEPARAVGGDGQALWLPMLPPRRGIPDAAPIVPALGERPAQAEAAHSYPALDDSFGGAVQDALLEQLSKLPIDVSMREPLDAYHALYPARYASLEQRITRQQADRIAGLGVHTPQQVRALSAPLAQYKALFPGSYPALRTRLGQAARQRLAALDKDESQLHNYNKLLAAAKSTFAGSALFSSLKTKIPPTDSKLIASEGYRAIEGGRLNAATAVLQRVVKEQPDALNLAAFRKDLEARRAKAVANFKKFDTLRRQNQPSRGKNFLESAIALWADNDQYKTDLESIQGIKDTVKPGECSPKLAGRGRNRRAVCYDRVAGKRGPTLVVVPAGGAISKAFAIGKFEVSIGDYNLYCRASQQCEHRKGSRTLPATDLSVKQMTAYAEWLSTQASRAAAQKVIYRLPSVAEWEHAANAGGKQPKKNFNCRVMLGEQVIKGRSLVNIKSGLMNGWGLANYIGNAQELAKSATGVVARGGAFEDPLSKCSVNESKMHSGAADKLTGFRLVREIDQELNR